MPAELQPADGALPDGAAEPETADLLIDTTQRTVRSTFEWLARGVDGWFGDRPFEEGGKVSDGRVSLSVLERFGDRRDVALRFRARFRLPNAERLAYVYIGRDDQRDLVTDSPDTLTRQQRLVSTPGDDQQFFFGLGVWLRDNFDARLGFRGPLKPYAQLRYQHAWILSEAGRVDFRQTFFMTVQDHAGSTTALSYQHAFSPTLAVRWLNSATITRRSRRYEWSSVVGTYQLFGEARQLALEVLATGQEGSGVDVGEYGLRARWEQPVRRKDLTGELIVGHFWPRPDPTLPRTGVWALGAGLNLSF